MKKIFALIFAAIIIITVLSGCTKGYDNLTQTRETETIEETYAPSEAVTEAETQAATQSDIPSAPLSDEELAPADILSFEILFNDKKLKIPFDFSELEEFGYFVTKDEDLKAQSHVIGVYPENKDGKTISVQFYNPTEETKKYSECKIGQIIYKPSDDYSLTLPGGLPFDGRATVEDIIAKYGEPKTIQEGSSYKRLEYGTGFSRVEFLIYSDPSMKKNDSVKLENMNN